MPRKVSRPCKHPYCPALTLNPNGFCDSHQSDFNPYFKPNDNRPSAALRGYGRDWKYRIRPNVLKQYGIPKDLWHLYDIDHNPPYDPEIEPDHEKYILIPRLRSEHSRKTNKSDGGLGNPKQGAGVSKSLQVLGVDRDGQVSSKNGKNRIGGVE